LESATKNCHNALDTTSEKEQTLDTLCRIWNDLPDALKAAIVAMVKTASAQYSQERNYQV
jgi:hypothetical protein